MKSEVCKRLGTNMCRASLDSDSVQGPTAWDGHPSEEGENAGQGDYDRASD